MFIDSCSPAAELDSTFVHLSMSTISSGGNEDRSYEMDFLVYEEELGDGSMSFKNMFKTILKAYDDERKWWVAVENFLKNENAYFATKVNCSSVFWHTQRLCILLVVNPHMQVRTKTHTGGRESRQQAIVEVMVDLLLNMEAITESQGLVYVLDELESYPVSGMEGWI